MGSGQAPGKPWFLLQPRKGFGVPSKTKGHWGEQPAVGISTLTSSMESSFGKQESFPGGMCCASSQARKNKTKTRGIRNKDLWDMK